MIFVLKCGDYATLGHVASMNGAGKVARSAQRLNPRRVELLHVFAGDERVLRLARGALTGQRHRGDWFCLGEPARSVFATLGEDLYAERRAKVVARHERRLARLAKRREREALRDAPHRRRKATVEQRDVRELKKLLQELAELAGSTGQPKIDATG